MKKHVDFETYLSRLIKFKVAERVGKQYRQVGLFGGRIVIIVAWSSNRRWRNNG